METRKKEILVLPSWYPSAINHLTGDFVQRHIEATALFIPLYVIHVVKDDEGKITRDVKSVLTQKENYTELVIYYHIKKTGIGFIDKFLSDRKYYQVYKKAVSARVEKNKPALVHVHIAMKAGMVACWLKIKYGIPYILSEQWTAYLPEADLKLDHHHPVFRQRIKKIINNADAITVVSNYLGEAIRKLFPSVSYTVIQNVVNHQLFFPVETNGGTIIRFIHASTMAYQKNVEDTLRALKIVREKKYDFTLDLFGPAPVFIQQLIRDLDLGDRVFLRGEVTQPELSREIQQSDLFLFYSRFETFGCVLIEANAAGIPVIVSDIPVFHELVTENVNGFFVRGEDPEKLAEKIIWFINSRPTTGKAEIAQTTNRYRYEEIGKKFLQLYDRVTGN
jgi:glycosyltransferase involved in cell wall biosynthesis